MRQVPAIMTATWQSGDYMGESRPMARVLVHRPSIRLVRTNENLFASLPFAGRSRPKELPNVKSVEWERDVNQDAASCTITFWNTDPLPIGQQPRKDELDRPGWYSYNRGTTGFSGRWGHTKNEWSYLLMPDNVLTVFEGYGFDGNVGPEFDPFLVQTGEWMIDAVEYTTNGLIVVRCRDYGRILHDQIMFPPVVPFFAGFTTKDLLKGAYSYPVMFRGRNSDPIITTTVEQVEIPATTGRIAMSFDNSSNTPYLSSKHSSVYGHYGKDAFDDKSSSYWLSIGNARPDQGYSFEWIQGSIKKQHVSSVRFMTKGKGYTAYLCLFANGQWLGSKTVPYNPNHPASAPNGSNTKYLKAMKVGSESWHTFELGKGYENVTKVRVTFGGLWYSGLGQFKYRAAMRRMEAYGGQPAATEEVLGTQVITFEDKNYDDYTDIVKLLCAWGGLYWPKDASKRLSDNSTLSVPGTPRDKAITIKQGRVWGDFQLSGTKGPTPIPANVFDKKPIIDGISYIRDILGYVFFIDELGGAVFKPPNIYSVGNTLRSLSENSGSRTRSLISIDERHSLMELSAVIDGSNLRERTFVANGNGTVGHMAAGWNPNPIGLRRVGGWTDQHFQTAAECQVMAEMIGIRQLFTYRTDTVKIPGNPAIQIDDQVRIYERVSSEGYIHYVQSVKSSLDLEDGEYTYTLGTHWLGERPFTRWVFDPAKLSRETQTYLKELYR